mgnify:CR=1 FL=1
MENFNRRFIYFICIVSAMGGLLFGYDWVVIGGAKPFYEVFFGIANEPTLQGLAMSIALAGCLVGAMVCGTLADRLGRKHYLPFLHLFFLFQPMVPVRSIPLLPFCVLVLSVALQSVWLQDYLRCILQRLLQAIFVVNSYL